MILIGKRPFFGIPTRYLPIDSIFSLSNNSLKLSSFFTRSFCTSNPQLNQNVELVYGIICESKFPEQLKQSLKSTRILLSNDLIDKVLKRIRFSHGHPLQALEFFYYTGNRRGFYHSAFSVDTMLYILGRNRLFDKIWDVLGEVKQKDRSLVTPRTVMVVLARVAKACSVRQTVESFMKFKRFIPLVDTHCFNSLLRALCQEKSMTDARNVYRSLKYMFRPNLQTFNILLSGWKSTEEAQLFFKEMREMGLNPDVVSYNSLMDVYCKGRELEKAYALVEQMRDEDVSPDVITYTILIGGLGLIGQPDKAKDVLKEMKEYGCYPDTAAYNAAIKNFCIAKRLGDAYCLMDEMVNKGLTPNATTYSLFFRVYAWTNDLWSSWNLYRKMMSNGCLPNTQSCMFLIRLFKRHEKMEMALQLWDDMIQKGFGAYTTVSDVLFDLLCDLGKLDEAERCFLQMIEKRQKPSTVSFKRIKVLMELASKDDALRNLSEQMSTLGNSIQLHENSGSLIGDWI